MKLTVCSLAPLFDFYSVDRPVRWEEAFGRRAPLHVEIGFGMGEVLLRRAREFPHINFVGIEYHWERIYKTVKAIDRANRAARPGEGPGNIRILRLNAWIAFERLFAERSVEHIYSLFPCPWPKKGHIKHRLFSREFLGLLNNRLTDNGTLHVVTDYYPYSEWVKEENDPVDFHLQAEDIPAQFGTKFEKKWIEEGQEEFFEINLLKNKHRACTVREDCELKSYKLTEFDPDKFSFEDVRGREVAVVLKDRIFDRDQQRMMLRVIVSEQHLTQNFWAMLKREDGFWRLCKMEGQHFFPTPGINTALEEIHLAAVGRQTVRHNN